MGFDLQSAEKYGCKIITVEPAQRRVEGVIKSGAVVQVAVYTVDPFFRWPKVGENWMIRRENGTWFLDSKWQNQEGESESNPTIVNNLNEGDALIDTPTGKVYLTSGNLLATEVQVEAARTAAQVKAEELIAAAKPQLVSVLPTPKDGLEVYFQNSIMSTAGVIWHLRYREASPRAHKWEYIGGASLNFGNSGVIHNTVSSEWKRPGSGEITPPLAGEYEVIQEGWFLGNTSGATNFAMTVAKVSALTTPLTSIVVQVTDTAGGGSQYNSITQHAYANLPAEPITGVTAISAGTYEYTVESLQNFLIPRSVG
jgi:hypothetical protein